MWTLTVYTVDVCEQRFNASFAWLLAEILAKLYYTTDLDQSRCQI